MLIDGSRGLAVVSHWWGEKIIDFLAALERHAELLYIGSVHTLTASMLCIRYIGSVHTLLGL